MKVKLLRKIRKNYTIYKLPDKGDRQYLYRRYEVVRNKDKKVIWGGFTIFDMQGVIETILIDLDLKSLWYKNGEKKAYNIAIRNKKVVI